MIKLKNPNDVRERIQALGGPSMLGRRIGVTRQRIHRWIKHGIPSSMQVKHPSLFMGKEVPSLPVCKECGRKL